MLRLSHLEASMYSEDLHEGTSIRSALIGRLLRLYLAGATLPASDAPVTISQIQRLIHSIIGEGYGPVEPAGER